MAAVVLTRHSLANGISDAKSERTTDQKGRQKLQHGSLSPDASLVKQLNG
jgi:hypothetical protein